MVLLTFISIPVSVLVIIYLLMMLHDYESGHNKSSYDNDIQFTKDVFNLLTQKSDESSQEKLLLERILEKIEETERKKLSNELIQDYLLEKMEKLPLEMKSSVENFFDFPISIQALKEAVKLQYVRLYPSISSVAEAFIKNEISEQDLVEHIKSSDLSIKEQNKVIRLVLF